MKPGDAYIKKVALALMETGETPTKALRRARLMWEKTQENERIIEQLMKEEK